MLERFFDASVTLERLRNNLLGPHLDSLAGILADLGYATSTGITYLTFSATFGRWLARNEMSIADIDEPVVEAFLDERGEPRFGGRAPALRHLLAHLREKAILPHVEVAIDATPLSLLEDQYERYLRAERGLVTATVISYLPFVRTFLVEQFCDGELRLSDLKPSAPSSFILRHARSMSLGRAKLMATALRSFFRFLLGRGAIAIDLAACVPSVARRRLSTVPKYLEPEEIQRVLDSCDRDQSTGRRNYAILLLLVRLGLRAGEIVALTLEDIDWRAGQITIAGKGLFRDPMPLPINVGSALAGYLLQDRPACSSRRVFIRRSAPYRGLARPSTVSTIARRALERAGLHPRFKGAHLFRHSLATGMLRRGATLAEIGEVLRHRTPQTTEIYAKVDLVGLRCVAQVWPESWGGQ